MRELPTLPGPIPHILVVDDEPDFATALAARLARRGFVAEAVFGGAAALDRLDEASWDVLLLDLRMPGIGGLEVLRRVGRRDPHLAVVVLSGHATVADGVAGLQLGAADFLQKPVEMDALCLALSAAVERTRAARGSQGGGA